MASGQQWVLVEMVQAFYEVGLSFKTSVTVVFSKNMYDLVS